MGQDRQGQGGSDDEDGAFFGDEARREEWEEDQKVCMVWQLKRVGVPEMHRQVKAKTRNKCHSR